MNVAEFFNKDESTAIFCCQEANMGPGYILQVLFCEKLQNDLTTMDPREKINTALEALEF
jgi:hypothetical protein